MTGVTCTSVGLQFGGYIGRMAISVRKRIVHGLVSAGLLPQGRQARTLLEVPMQLRRIAQPLLGRDVEVEQVIGSLKEHGAAVVWGGPGEGKSSVAMEAACRMWDAEQCLGGCFLVNCVGAQVAGLLFTDIRIEIVYHLSLLHKCLTLQGIELLYGAGARKDGDARAFVAATLVPSVARCKVCDI